MRRIEQFKFVLWSTVHGGVSWGLLSPCLPSLFLCLSLPSLILLRSIPIHSSLVWLERLLLNDKDTEKLRSREVQEKRNSSTSADRTLCVSVCRCLRLFPYSSPFHSNPFTLGCGWCHCCYFFVRADRSQTDPGSGLNLGTQDLRPYWHRSCKGFFWSEFCF